MSQRNLKIIYTPEGGSEREWVVDLANPAWDVNSQTERATDWPWAEFRERLGNQSGLALQALLWVLRKRDEPRLELQSVVPDPDMWEKMQAQCPACREWGVDVDHVASCQVEPEESAPGDGPGEA